MSSIKPGGCLALLLVLAGGAPSWSQPLAVPNDFRNGDPANAEDVNANFTAVEDAVNAQGANLDQAKTDIDANTAAAAAANAGVAANSAATTANGAAISALQSDTATNAGAIGQNAAEIGVLQADATSLGGRVTAIENDLINGNSCQPGAFVTAVAADGTLTCEGPTAQAPLTVIGTVDYFGVTLDLLSMRLGGSRKPFEMPYTPSGSPDSELVELELLVLVDQPGNRAQLFQALNTGDNLRIEVELPLSGPPTPESFWIDTDPGYLIGLEPDVDDPQRLRLTVRLDIVRIEYNLNGQRSLAQVSFDCPRCNPGGTSSGCPVPTAYSPQPVSGETAIDSVGFVAASEIGRSSSGHVSLNNVAFGPVTPCLFAGTFLNTNLTPSGTIRAFDGAGNYYALGHSTYLTDYELAISSAGTEQSVRFLSRVVCVNEGASSICWDYLSNTAGPEP